MSVAEHLRSRRCTLPCRDSSHTPRDASSRPVAHAPSSSTDHQLHFWDCRFVADPCTSTRLRTLIARAQAPLSRASLARLRLWSFVTWNRLPGFCITRISVASDGSPLPGPRQLLVTAYSDLILVRRFMQGLIDSRPSYIHSYTPRLVRITPLAHRRPRKCTSLASPRCESGSLNRAPRSVRARSLPPSRGGASLRIFRLGDCRPSAERQEAVCSSAQVFKRTKSSSRPYQPVCNALRPAPHPSSTNPRPAARSQYLVPEPSFGAKFDGIGTSRPIDGVGPSRLVSSRSTSCRGWSVWYNTMQFNTIRYGTAWHGTCL